jgi:hypothetical protein
MLLHLSSFAVYGKKLRTDLRLQIQTTLVVPTASLLNATNQTRWRYSPRHPRKKKYLLSLSLYPSPWRDLQVAKSRDPEKEPSCRIWESSSGGGSSSIGAAEFGSGREADGGAFVFTCRVARSQPHTTKAEQIAILHHLIKN